MTRLLTPKLGAYGTLAAAGFLAALFFGQPEAAVLGMPFALVAIIGLALAREPVLAVETELDRDRVLEDESAVLAIRLRALSAVAGLLLHPRLSDGLSSEPLKTSGGISLAPGEERTLEMLIRAAGWGSYDLGSILLRAGDRFGFFIFEHSVDRLPALRVYPRPERLRSSLGPRESQVHAGNTVSRERGDGIEFADVRQFVPGDRVRHVNWRVSARRGELHVNQHHPERNTDVVIFIDTFAAVGEGRRTTIDLAVRGAASLAHRYLRTRDRVGMIGFGGVIRWLRPGLGMVQLYRLLDSLLDTRVVTSYAWKGIDVIPTGTLPPKALLLVLSPLTDERTIGALLDVRGRGFDVAVLELDPAAYVSRRTDERGELAHRLWLLHRETIRDRFRTAGIPVAQWNHERALEAALEEVRASRRHASRLRA